MYKEECWMLINNILKALIGVVKGVIFLLWVPVCIIIVFIKQEIKNKGDIRRDIK